MMDATTERIRALNDELRTQGKGGDVVVTRGLAALGLGSVALVFAAVQAFADFRPDNDPYGEHDFGLLQVAHLRVIFKIDYYDQQLRGHSPDPSDGRVTPRVLTIMLADEY
jgi:hypothetical protein